MPEEAAGDRAARREEGRPGAIYASTRAWLCLALPASVQTNAKGEASPPPSLARSSCKTSTFFGGGLVVVVSETPWRPANPQGERAAKEP